MTGSSASGAIQFRSGGDWAVEDRRFRLAIVLQDHQAVPGLRTVELRIRLDMAQLRELGHAGVVDPDAMVVVAADGGDAGFGAALPHQYDWDARTDAGHECGSLLVLVTNDESGHGPLHGHLYFDLSGAAWTPVPVSQPIAVWDATDEDQECYRIVTPLATYDYQKRAAAFSSLLDRDGNDWIGYRGGGGSAGEFRGIPNMIHPEGHFHPGSVGAVSSLVSAGPLKVTIYSETVDGAWACVWDLFPTHATVTVLKAANPYWFLYEGTPGGTFAPERTVVVRSTGERAAATEPWTEDSAGLKWVIFENAERSLFFIRHEEDGATDSYWLMNGEMTVFGFGRTGLDKSLFHVPARFTIGLYDHGEAQTAAFIQTLI